MGPATGTPSQVNVTAGALDLLNLSAALRLLANGDDLSGLVRRMDPLHVDYAEAARRLNIPEKWLRERIQSLPHRKMGKFVGFTEDDLRAISEMYAVRPEVSASPGQRPSAVSPLTPSHRSRVRSRA